MAIQLEEMVQKPTWKEVLLDLIVSNKLDPWNIDLVAVCDAFLKKIKDMKRVELFIPANIILASAILLRYKSDIIRFEEEAQQVLEVPQEEEYQEVPELKMAARIPPKRKVTLNELMEELDKVIKYEEDRNDRAQTGKIEEIVNINVDAVDIEKVMEEVYNLVMKNMNGDGHVLFSKLVEDKEKRDTVYTLISLLHLSQREKIELEQKKIFGDIYIRKIKEI